MNFDFYDAASIEEIKKRIRKLKPVKGTTAFDEMISTKDGRFYAKTGSNEDEKLLKLNF